MKIAPRDIAVYSIAACLVYLTGERIFDRFISRYPQMVWVRGGNIDATIDGGSIDSVGKINDQVNVNVDGGSVRVDGGKLDYETDALGRLEVVPTR